MKRALSYEDLRRRRSRALRFLRFMAALFILYEFFAGYSLKSYIVGSGSMEPTLSKHDRLVVFPSAYGLLNPLTGRHGAFRAPERGDVILLRPPSSTDRPWYARFAGSALRYITFQRVGTLRQDSPFESAVIKRVVAVPGDTVKVEGFIAQVKTQGSGHFLTEYEVTDSVYDVSGIEAPAGWGDDMPLSGAAAEITLGPGEYFVLGDKRSSSADSRFFGPVSSKDILGKALFRYWPLDKASGL